MSDTKALIKYVRDRLHDGPNITFGKPTVCDLVEALEQVEAENDRLTKMVDWLADKLAEQNICRATHNKDKTISLRAIDADEWKEAASRSVADAESEVKG